MRRKEKQITDKNILQDILGTNTICRIGLVDSDRPYILPMNYGYDENTIFLHSAPEGKKIDLIKKNNNVCVEVTDSIDLVTADQACGYGSKFRSVICRGKITELSGKEEKTEGLQIIMKQHTGKENWDFPDKAVEKTAILKIEIESMTGKSSG